MLQQLPVGFNPLQQQQVQHFQHVQQQRRSQQPRQLSRTHAVPVTSIPAPYHNLQHTDRLAFYPELTPVPPVQGNNTFIQTPISAVSTVPNFATQPALSQPQSIIYTNAPGYRIPTQQQPIPEPVQQPHPQPPAPAVSQVRSRNVTRATPSQPTEDSTFSTSNFEGLKIVPSPPNLEQWREKLFQVDRLMILTEDEYVFHSRAITVQFVTNDDIRFQTYFPHADNVYSHRSTQRYKAKPFVSHYFDCRLKGRPAGTPKSEDPNKKKRKRSKRERDLCDVKIKITEFFAGATRDDIQGHLNLQPRSSELRAEDILAMVNAEAIATSQPAFDSVMGGMATAQSGLAASKRFYTIQRVNGTGAGGTRGEQICPNHRHTLEDSDKIKKNSVIRALAKNSKNERPVPAPVSKSSICNGNISA